MKPFLMIPLTALVICFSMGLSRTLAFANIPLNTPQIQPESLADLTAKSGILDRVSRLGVGSHKVSIAILDNGFRDYQKAIGASLPSTTRYHQGPVPVDPKTEEFHGLKMAEIVSHLLTAAGVEFELHLYSAFGFSNFRHSIDRVIERKHDLVLYAQVWEYGGNPDGSGFINQEVSRALRAGVKWINAAGNYARGAYLDRVDRIADDWAYLPGPNSSVQVRCRRPDQGKCPIRAVLSWSAFSDSINVGTDKDLDLVLSDDTLKVIQVGGLKQVQANPKAGESLYPREIVQSELKPGLYYLRVKVRSASLSKKDYLRITVVGDGLELLDRTEGETILAPADLPDVITVGGLDSRLSSFSRKLRKPNFRAPSLLLSEEAASFLGSSTAAAVATALAAVELSLNPRLSRMEVQMKLQTHGDWSEKSDGEEGLRHSTGQPTRNESAHVPINRYPITSHDGRSCLTTTVLRILTPDIRQVMRGGLAWSVMTNTGVKIIIDEDPFTKLTGQGKLGPGEILVLGVDRFGQPERILNVESWRAKLFKLSAGPQPTHVEVVKIDSNIRICP
jgi:hypothetical protein